MGKWKKVYERKIREPETIWQNFEEDLSLTVRRVFGGKDMPWSVDVHSGTNLLFTRMRKTKTAAFKIAHKYMKKVQTKKQAFEGKIMKRFEG